MSIRFKTVEYCWWTPRSTNDPSPTEVCIDEVLPLRDWNANPKLVNVQNWVQGTSAPAPIPVQITFPELEYIYQDYTKFRFKVRKNINGVDFVNVTGSGLTGDVFDGFNPVKKTIQVNFQNLDNLSVGTHELTILVEAYGVSNDGVETPAYLEDSTFQGIYITVRLTVLSGSGFGTDKNTYQINYNKADGSMSGDAKIVVYSDSLVTTQASDPFISLNQTNSATERYLNFQNNAFIQAKEVGTYSGTVLISKGSQSKTVTVNLNVVNDASQFYIDPVSFSGTIQKNLAESKTFVSGLSNPNHLNIVVDLKPSFIDHVNITANSIEITSLNSSQLAVGTYQGDIILKAGSVQKTINIRLFVLEAITHDFSGSAYYFALDKKRVIVNKTKEESSYVRMSLNMYFKGFGEEYQELQTYTFPFFKGSVEIFPGEEIQDFFINAKNINVIDNPLYQYDLALVTMTFEEVNAADVVVSSFTLDNVRFAPGKKPKCFPIFTNHPVRSTYSTSQIKLSVDSYTEKPDLVSLYEQYLDVKPVFASKPTVERYTFLREKFNPNLSFIQTQKLQFIPMPEVSKTVHIDWETENLVFDWFTAVENVKKTVEIEHITGESKINKEEKFDSNLSKNITVNSGWILEEEIDVLTDLLCSRLVFITVRGKRYKAFPIGKKNELADTNNNKFSMDLEFKLIIEK